MFTLNQSDNPKEGIEVNFPRDISLYYDQNKLVNPWLVTDELGNYMLQFAVGQGLLTVLTSTSIFNNKQIADYDHARFLHHLVQLEGHNQAVWLIRVDDMPSLWQWLWSHAWYLMFSLTLLFILWLWRAPLRFGPLLADKSLKRRRLIEHIQASGYYRWHDQQSGYLLLQVQDSVWNDIHLFHPDIYRDDQQQAYHQLAKITGLKQSSINQSFKIRDQLNEQDFTKHIQMLELIRQYL
jgi:hypothetical protein